MHCLFLKKEGQKLESPPYPGALGERIYNEISQEAWVMWLKRLAAIINENGLNTADPAHLELIEKHMVGFLFQEGDFGDAPEGFSPSETEKQSL